jgi:hypothetical protein
MYTSPYSYPRQQTEMKGYLHLTLPQGNGQDPLNSSLWSFRANLQILEMRKTSCPYPGLELRNVTPNSSRYTDDTTPAPHTSKDARQKNGAQKSLFGQDRALGIARCSLSLHTDCCSPFLTLCRLTRPDIRKLTSPLKTILTVNISSWSQKKKV